MPKLLDNFWLKVTAVILGLLVWMHVATEKEYSYDMRLPVTDVALGDSLTLASPPPETLTVSVSAIGKELLRKKWRDRGLRINASQFSPGRHQVALTANNVSLVGPTGELQLEDVVAPTQVNLNIDILSDVTLPVTGNFVAEADEGYAVAGAPTITPDSAILFGPRSVVRRFHDIATEAKQLKGLRGDVTLRLALDNPPMHGLSVAPESVTVEIHVVPVKTRVFEAVPVRVFNAPLNDRLVLSPARVRIEITGPPADIDRLDVSTVTASVNYRTRAGSGKAALKIDCPPAFRIKSISTDSILITIPSETNADSRN
ncbi:hypothetical protein KQH82_04695 [bacterium]|nr:hypothetical protein [bacterium]